MKKTQKTPKNHCPIPLEGSGLAFGEVGTFLFL